MSISLAGSSDDPSPTVTGLSRKQNVHRIIDFFSAAQAISENILHIPLAAQFEDPNEGIDAAIEILAISAGPCAGITRFFRTHEEFSYYQKSITSRNYVSCWTKTKESVAMWALYSKDYSSVQITTTVENIERATLGLAEVSLDPRPAIYSGLQNGQFLDHSKITNVIYDDLQSIATKVDRRRRAYDKLEAAGKVSQDHAFPSRSARDRYRANQYHFSALELKDSSFTHEAEVRLIIAYCPYTSTTLSTALADLQKMEDRLETKVANPTHEISMLQYARAILREQAIKEGLTCKDSIALPLHSGFISEVTIDPRCSAHKRRFMREYFEQHGVPVVESTCFGHAASHFSMKPRRSLIEIGN